MSREMLVAPHQPSRKDTFIRHNSGKEIHETHPLQTLTGCRHALAHVTLVSCVFCTNLVLLTCLSCHVALHLHISAKLGFNVCVCVCVRACVCVCVRERRKIELTVSGKKVPIALDENRTCISGIRAHSASDCTTTAGTPPVSRNKNFRHSPVSVAVLPNTTSLLKQIFFLSIKFFQNTLKRNKKNCIYRHLVLR